MNAVWCISQCRAEPAICVYTGNISEARKPVSIYRPVIYIWGITVSSRARVYKIEYIPVMNR